MPSLSVLAGPAGLAPGIELTFFYPSTEWRMAQSFECFCSTASCRGRIAGASDMSSQQLEGMWLNGYIREMLEEWDAQDGSGKAVVNGTGLEHGYGHWHVQSQSDIALNGNGNGNGKNAAKNGHGWDGGVVDGVNSDAGEASAARSGPTSRELSGEMGGDTKSN